MDHSEKSERDWTQPKLNSPDFKQNPQIPAPDLERIIKSLNSAHSPVPKSQSTFPNVKSLDSPEQQFPQPQLTVPLTPPIIRPELTLPDNGAQPKSSASP